MGVTAENNNLWSSLPITLWADILSLRYDRDSCQKNILEGGEGVEMGKPAQTAREQLHCDVSSCEIFSTWQRGGKGFHKTWGSSINSGMVDD